MELEQKCQSLAKLLVSTANEKHVTIGCAESCTGGLLSSYITSVPGSSACFKGGVVSYTNSVKHNVLGVLTETLEVDGAVSESCARQMARGVCGTVESEIGVSITGIAGPQGATHTKPVGMVCFGLSRSDNTDTYTQYFQGNREEVRLQAVIFAFGLLLAEVS